MSITPFESFLTESILVNDIIEAIDSIEEYTNDYSLEQFLEDKKTREAVIRNIEISGEAVRNIPDEIKTKYSKIEWRDIIGMRNIIAHEYFGIEMAQIWQTIEKEIPKLKKAISSLLDL